MSRSSDTDGSSRHALGAPLRGPHCRQHGRHLWSGPHATPVVAGERLYAVGATGKLFALDKKTGRVIWSHDLVDELGVRPGWGYANSPLAYQGSLILPIGGTGPGLVAFDLKDGRLLWKNQSFDRAPASPVLIQVDGEEQLVLFHAEGIAGVDPKNGALLWGHPHRTDYGLNISTPVWGEDNLLFLSSAYSGGSARPPPLACRGKDPGSPPVVFQSPAHPLRHRHPPRRHRLRLERGFRPGLPDRGRHQDGQDVVAGTRLCPGADGPRERTHPPPR
jgi:hypothetical protein